MSRVDDLPENQLVERVKTINLEIEQLKNRQFTGSESVVTKQTLSGNTWDINDTVASGWYARWRVAFVPTTPNRPYTQVQIVSNTTPSLIYGFFDVYMDPFLQSDGFISFYLDFVNYSAGTADVKVKIAFISVDTGTISVTRLADY